MKNCGCVKILELLRTVTKEEPSNSFDFTEAKPCVASSGPLILFSYFRVGKLRLAG